MAFSILMDMSVVGVLVLWGLELFENPRIISPTHSIVHRESIQCLSIQTHLPISSLRPQKNTPSIYSKINHCLSTFLALS